MKRSLAKGLFATVALALACSFARPANAVIVERIVAVVGDRPILLSDLRQRARPFINRIAAQAQNPAQQAAQESEMYRELLGRLIDDRLEEQAADKARLVITPDEVDNAIRNVAAQAKRTVPELIDEVRRQGISEQDYRDEIRRQLIEGKLVQLRVRGRVRVTEQDARAAYNRFVKEIGDQVLVDARLLPLRILPGITS
jgi:peptidyl-prolyl cis-trans isomerase SurA